MNGLGLFQFDYVSGSTAWRDRVISVDPNGDTVEVRLAVSNVADNLLDSRVVVDFIQQATESISPALRWDPVNGGMELTTTVTGTLQQDRKIDIYYARGKTFESRIGNPITSVTLPAGSGGTVRRNIAGNLLADDPAGTTDLIAVVTPMRVAALTDVNLRYEPAALQHPGQATMNNIVKDGLRAAGQANARVTSAFRRPEDQARIMFNVLTQKADIQKSITEQEKLYGPVGDLVIKVFKDLAGTKSQAEILAMRSTIQGAMLDEINRQTCVRVSNHCADPAVRVTIDIGFREFGQAGNGRRFIDSVRPRVGNFLDESCLSNNAYHLELGQGATQAPPKC